MIILDMLGLTTLMAEIWGFFNVPLKLGVGITIFLVVWCSVFVEDHFFYKKFGRGAKDKPKPATPTLKPFPRPHRLVERHVRRSFKALR